MFDPLLPKSHNEDISTLLFTCAHWHALAKLCMHTDETLTLLDFITGRLGRGLRRFQQKTCTAFDTQELKWEVECWQRHGLKNTAGNSTAAAPQSTWRKKTFNLQTYKLHALGDYTNSIHKYGTTDSYSTEIVGMCTWTILLYSHGKQGELEHRTSKARHHRTNWKQFVKQMTSIKHCEAWTCHIHNINKLSPSSAMVQETVAATPDAHFHIGKSQNSPENLLNFLCKHSDNPAIKVSRILLECRPLTLSKNRTSFPSLNAFYSLKWRSFGIKKINFTWGGIRHPLPVQAWFLWKDRFTSQAIAFISII